MATPEKKRKEKKDLCGKVQSSQEASQQPTDPWAVLLVRQVAATAAQPGSHGILLASQQAGTWPACPSNGQAGSQAAARERLARQAHGFGRRPATELSWTTVSQNLPDPGKKKIG